MQWWRLMQGHIQLVGESNRMPNWNIQIEYLFEKLSKRLWTNGANKGKNLSISLKWKKWLGPLETYEWSGNYYSPDNYRFDLYYILSKNETIVFEEYLIYDLIGFIGSAGGTLGMFIGFSFINIISVILYQLRKCLFHVISKLIK